MKRKLFNSSATNLKYNTGNQRHVKIENVIQDFKPAAVRKQIRKQQQQKKTGIQQTQIQQFFLNHDPQ